MLLAQTPTHHGGCPNGGCNRHTRHNGWGFAIANNNAKWQKQSQPHGKQHVVGMQLTGLHSKRLAPIVQCGQPLCHGGAGAQCHVALGLGVLQALEMGGMGATKVSQVANTLQQARGYPAFVPNRLP